jgi:hypothetical protein
MAWSMKGSWFETCAAEGHCSLWFGRDLEEPCTSFQVFKIDEGQINGIDIGGTLVMILADLFSPKFADLMAQGGEGGIYINDKADEEQRKELENFFANNISGTMLLRKPLGVRFVKIDMKQEGNTYHFKMPYGEIKTSLAIGGDGKNPQRIENSLFSMVFNNIRICNTHLWKYNDFGKEFEFVNRSGAVADFDMQG